MQTFINLSSHWAVATEFFRSIALRSISQFTDENATRIIAHETRCGRAVSRSPVEACAVAKRESLGFADPRAVDSRREAVAAARGAGRGGRRGLHVYARFRTSTSPVVVHLHGAEARRARAAQPRGERPAFPREAVAVLAGERHERRAGARGVDHPAAADGDSHVVDLRRLRPALLGAEEGDVAGRELRERDPSRSCATSALIAKVVRPRRVAASAAAPG